MPSTALVLSPAELFSASPSIPCARFFSLHPATDVNNLTDCSLSLSKEESVSDEEEGEEHGN